MIYRYLRKTYRFFRKHCSCFEYCFEAIGLILGIITPIILIVAGIASLPFTGGASSILLWLGYICFAASIYVTFVNAARAWGILLDAVIEIKNGQHPNNEKIATATGFVVGLVLAFVAVALNFAPVPFISSLIHIALWKGALLIVPWIIGFTAACARVSGRLVDHFQAHFPKTTLQDLLSPNKNEDKNIIPPKHMDIESALIANGIKGIYQYLETRDENKLNIVSKCFDRETGKKRALMYYHLLHLPGINSDLQKVILLYVLLGSGQGATLKKSVCHSMQLKEDEARNVFRDYIQSHVVDKNKRILLQENVIDKLSFFADRGKGLHHKRRADEMKIDYLNIVNYMKAYQN